MTIKTITSAALITAALLINPASSAEPNWRLVVVFVEESVGAINRLPRTYEKAWIKRGGEEKAHRKVFRAAEKAKVEGTKHGTWTRDVTTNSTKWVAIYDYAKMRTMWKGPPKKLNALRFLKGKSIADLQKQIEKKAAENKYLGYRAVEMIDMQAAKVFLNSQAQNPFFGDLPANVTATNKTGCEANHNGHFSAKHDRCLAIKAGNPPPPHQTDANPIPTPAQIASVHGILR